MAPRRGGIEGQDAGREQVERAVERSCVFIEPRRSSHGQCEVACVIGLSELVDHVTMFDEAAF